MSEKIDSAERNRMFVVEMQAKKDNAALFLGCINPDMARSRYVQLLKAAEPIERNGITDAFLIVLAGMHGKEFFGVSGEGKQYKYTYKLNPKIEKAWQEIVLAVNDVIGGEGNIYIKRSWLWVECSGAGGKFSLDVMAKLAGLGLVRNFKRCAETGLDILIFKAEGAPRARGSKASYYEMKRKSFVQAGERQ